MSFTMRVPAVVRSVIHNSSPWMPSLARNITRLGDPNITNSVAPDDWVAGFRSPMETVPAGLPSVYQGSAPVRKLPPE